MTSYLSRTRRTILTLILFLFALPEGKTESEAIRVDFKPSFAERFSLEKAKEEYLVKRCAVAPTMDGSFDDPPWADLPTIVIGEGNDTTTIRACFDEQNLYIAFACARADKTPLHARKRERDAAVWQDDAVEICIGSPGPDGVWYHFIINAAGSVFDRKMQGARGDNSYDPSFRHSVNIDASAWKVEVAIPMDALGLDEWPSTIGVSLGRDGPSRLPEFWGSRRDVNAASFRFEGVPESQAPKKDDAPFLSNQFLQGKSLALYIDREHIRPGERWAEIEFAIHPQFHHLSQTRVIAKVFAVPGTSQAVAELTFIPEKKRGRLEIDLRTLGLERARVSIEVVEGDRLTGSSEFYLGAATAPTQLTVGQLIPVNIDTPDTLDPATTFPVTFGMPFAAGTLWNPDRLRLVDGFGNPLPFQMEVTGRWAPEGSIQWVRFDALVIPENQCFVEVVEPFRGMDSSIPPRSPQLSVTKSDDRITINTGPAQYILGPGPSPVHEIRIDGKRVAHSANTHGLYVIDQNGRLAQATAKDATMELEAHGPVASSVRFEGWYETAEGERLARHVTRVELFACAPEARVTHSLVLSEDSNKIWFREVGWEFQLDDKNARHSLFGLNAEPSFHEQTGGMGSIAHTASYFQGEPEIPVATCEVILGNNMESAHMLQRSYYMFGHGENVFEIAVRESNGTLQTIVEGEECGDYALLLGNTGGLALFCRDAARQHPKEFEVRPGIITLKLFSNRAGEELDFRTETLLEKWNVEAWQRHAPGDFRGRNVKNELKNFVSNAAGWSKTHTLRLLPTGSSLSEAMASVKQQAHALQHEVFAHVDPEWIYASRVLGPLYPRDTKRFPKTEKMVDAFFEELVQHGNAWGENGFIDYASGPQFHYVNGKWPEMRRNGMTYLLRPGLWQLYARSGDRAIREYAEKTNQTVMDARHWQWGPNRGLLRTGARLPFYWVVNANMEFGNSSSLNHLIWQYQLTGYRRAGDTLRDFAQSAKRIWTPARAMHPTYPPNVLWLLTQVYGFTQDREIRDLALATMALLEDDETAMGISSESNYLSNTYKGNALSQVYIDAWETIGNSRFLPVAQRYSELFTARYETTPPYQYMRNARAATFHYEDTGSDATARSLLNQVQWANSNYSPKDASFANSVSENAAMSNFITDIGYALHVVADSNMDVEHKAVSLAYDDLGYDTEILFQKPENEALRFRYRTPGGPSGPLPFDIIKTPQPPDIAIDTFHMTLEPSIGRVLGTVTLPKEMPSGTYRMRFTGIGEHWFLGESAFPLVLHAPNYWYPLPPQDPPVPWYFMVPKDVGAKIFFEGRSRLFDPDGIPYPSDEPVTGWVDLPSDRPGLWAFEPLEAKAVRTRNIPPFFAFGDPLAYFLPDVEWHREDEAESFPTLQGTVFGPGSSGQPNDQALYLMGNTTFRIDAGPKHPDKDGTLFLPQNEGTIEFFVRPAWSSPELPDQIQRILFAPIESPPGSGGSHSLSSDYRIDGRDKTIDFLFDTAYENSPTDKGVTKVRRYRNPTLFEQGKWTHIAYVWGPEDNTGYHPRRIIAGQAVMTADIFVNGRRITSRSNRNSGQNSALVGPLRYLQFGHRHQRFADLDMAIDELRISDKRRYSDDFTPPSKEDELNLDKHTRSLFRFDGTLDGETWGSTQPVPGHLP